MVKTKRNEVFGVNSYVCRNYKEKLVGWPFCNPHPE